MFSADVTALEGNYFALRCGIDEQRVGYARKGAGETWKNSASLRI